MAEDHGLFTLDDIEYDLECGKAAAARLAPPAVRTRGGQRLRVSSGVGGRLLAASSDGTRLRYQTLLDIEASFPPTGDYGFLICAACQILEAELDRLVATPARAVVHRLADALRNSGENSSQVDILDRWSRGTLETTLGVDSILLLGLRRAWEQGDDAARNFLETRFRPRYRELLASKDLGRCLDEVRQRYRNPACHGKDTFDAAAYARFVRKTVASVRFAAWDVRGPDPADPAAAEGVLHHHLSQSQQVAADAAVPRPGRPG